MKYLSGIFLCAASMFAQTGGFTNGQAARLVIGQATFTSEDSNSSDVFIGGVSGLAYGNDTLLVADANYVGALPNNHRVLIYQGLSSMLPGPTDLLAYNRKCPVCVGQATSVLGQPDFTTTTENINATSSALRLPTAVATDGVHVVVADTNHNRVLIWNRIPAVNNQAADVVVGQPDMVSSGLPPNNTPTAKSMRGPQGVWIQDGKLYVADTQNNRILIYNHIPTANGVAADLVLGEPNFTTTTQPDLTQQTTSATAQTLLNPVSVTSDGVHLFVTDLGYNRVLIWNSIPTANYAAADVEIGQPDMNSSVADNAYTVDTTSTLSPQPETPVLCTVSNGTDANSNPTYPDVCNYTLSYPRFALAGGGRLFIADGGNDRVLVYNTIPTQNAVAADIILGQLGGTVNQATDAADSMYCPTALAWDGSNLYVSDPYDRRITVYTLATVALPYQAVRNAAAMDIIAFGTVTIAGTIHAGDIVTISIGNATTATPVQYSYTVKATDLLSDVVQGLVNAISSSNSGAGDPNVIVTVDTTATEVVLTSRVPGDAGNAITLTATVSSGSQVTATASGDGNLTGGGDAAKIAPGTIVAILAADGTTIAAQTASADTSQPVATQLGGTSVYFNGIPSPVISVSPTQVNAQIPWEVTDSTSINAYVRSVMSDGTIQVTSPVAVTIVPANPGVFPQPGDTNSPPAGLVLHGSSRATGIVSVDGTTTANDVVTVTVEDRAYSYTVQSTDSLASVRDNLVALISQDPKVTATASGEYTRLILTALVEGPDGDNIPYSASSSNGASEVMTAFSAALCCANVGNSQVTQENPAAAGEFITVTATGLGLPVLDDTIAPLISTGIPYPQGAPITTPAQALSSLAGGSTADVIFATLMPGTVGTYQVVLHLNSGLSTNTAATLTIAQNTYVSQTVTFPVQSP